MDCDLIASWVVTLSSGKDDRELQCKIQNAVQRAVKLRPEWICSFEMSWKFLLARSLSLWEFQSFGRFRTGQSFGLVRLSLRSLDVSCHEFCTVFIFAA